MVTLCIKLSWLWLCIHCVYVQCLLILLQLLSQNDVTQRRKPMFLQDIFFFFCPCWRNEHSFFQQLRTNCCKLKAGSGHFCSCLKSALCHDVTSQVTTRQRTAKVSSGFPSPVTRKYSQDILDWITSRDNVKWNQYKVEWTVLCYRQWKTQIKSIYVNIEMLNSFLFPLTGFDIN